MAFAVAYTYFVLVFNLHLELALNSMRKLPLTHISTSDMISSSRARYPQPTGHLDFI